MSGEPNCRPHRTQRILAWMFFSLMSLLTVGYIGSYLCAKHHCRVIQVSYPDTRKGDGSVMIFRRSNGKIWHETEYRRLYTIRQYHEPSWHTSDWTKVLLNRIYFPVQELDQRITGWSVRYQDP